MCEGRAAQRRAGACAAERAHLAQQVLVRPQTARHSSACCSHTSSAHAPEQAEVGAHRLLKPGARAAQLVNHGVADAVQPNLWRGRRRGLMRAAVQEIMEGCCSTVQPLREEDAGKCLTRRRRRRQGSSGNFQSHSACPAARRPAVPRLASLSTHPSCAGARKRSPRAVQAAISASVPHTR